MKSLMFVPGKPKMLGKIDSSDADAYIIDMEDSINECDKAQALEDVCLFLSTTPNKIIYIRVAGNHLEEEFNRLLKYDFCGYMLPKFEDASVYVEYADALKGKEVIALVETPMGLMNLRETASNPLVSSIAFGAEDFTSAIGMTNCAETLYYARSEIVTCGKAFHKPVYDTPSFIIDDVQALEKEIQIAVDLGFDGKLAIHPKQISLINELFLSFDLTHLKMIVEQYETAGEAVLRIGDKIYEKMHIAHFKRILREHGIN
ncbi:MAG: CoA ester lyase [Ruminococcus sp.]|nr:CoA ester lyase [Ruminococcus sp.]